MKKLSQFLKLHISGMLEAISLEFGMLSTEVGGRIHSKNHLVSSRQHRATEEYTHGCCTQASWALILVNKCPIQKQLVKIPVQLDGDTA